MDSKMTRRRGRGRTAGARMYNNDNETIHS